MKKLQKTVYDENIGKRGKIHYLKGLFPRYFSHLRNRYIVWIARRRGATIGDCVTMPYKLAKKANANLIIGNHTSIQTERLDLRGRVTIGSYVIIGAEVEIITISHEIDSPDWEHKVYGIDVEDYSWLATRAFILPSCRRIARGAICAAGSVIARNIEAMEIVTGSEGKSLRYRNNVHTELCVESLLGNDFFAYRDAYKKRAPH